MKKKKKKIRPQEGQPDVAAASVVLDNAEEELDEELESEEEELDDESDLDSPEEDEAAAAEPELEVKAEDPVEDVEPEPEAASDDAAELIDQLEAELLGQPDPPAPDPSLRDIVAEHLKVIRDRGPVTVDEFRRYLEIPGWGAEHAKLLLVQYVDQGYVARTWSNSKGRYSLTEAGRLRAG